jgi:hypothetical protein
MRLDGFAWPYLPSRKNTPKLSQFVDKAVENVWTAVDRRCTKAEAPEDRFSGAGDRSGEGYSRMTLTLS